MQPECAYSLRNATKLNKVNKTIGCFLSRIYRTLVILHLYSPSSRVLFTLATLNGPGPSLVYALTLMVYSTSSSNPPSSTISTEPLVVVSLVEGISSNVLWLTSTSYWVMIPFLEISGTGSHVTRMAVEERVRTCTLSGGAFGATEMEETEHITTLRSLHECNNILTIFSCPIVHSRTEWSRADNGVRSDGDGVFNVLLKSTQYY